MRKVLLHQKMETPSYNLHFALFIHTMFLCVCTRINSLWSRLKNNLNEPTKVFRRIAKWNGRIIPSNVVLLPMPDHAAADFKDLFTHHKIALKSVIQAYAWFVNGLIFYGLALAADDLVVSQFRHLKCCRFSRHVFCDT